MTRRTGAAPRRVVHVGPAIGAQGGISSVLRVLHDSAEFPGYSVRFEATVARSGGALAPVAGGLRTVGIGLRALLSPRSIYHLHVASRGSFYRKALVYYAARVRGHATVIHLHGGKFHLFVRDAGPFTRRLVRSVFSNADEVVVLSPEWRERVAAFSGREGAAVVPNPVVIPATATRANADTVVFLGRLSQVKGTADLIEAVGLVQQAGNTATRWVLAGDGDASEFQAAVSRLPRPEAVEMPGWLSRERVAELLSGARVFCLPSHDEGKPVALLEAMAYGLACVATPVGGVPDVVVDGRNGVLVPPGDPVALAGALTRCLGDEDLRGRLGAAARETVRESYAVDVVAGTLSGIYERVAR